MKGKGHSKLHGVYKSVIGKKVLVPASEFGVDIPEMYYRARVTKKDPSHPGAVVVKYDDDGTLAWWPVEHILGWIQEAEAAGVSDTIGSAAQIFAAEVLTDLASSGRRGTERSHADNSGSPPQSTARVHSGADSASSSQMSETSMAALGRSMGEEACGGVLSSLKGSRPAAGGREGSWRHRW